ncbi:MAG: hypothetical protein J6J17_00870 [Bacilli bacterium]|nr:hypothetical protein [Bacilli bacterium]
MKKALGMMVLGAGMGAGAVFMYDQYKSGKLGKMVSKAGKEVTKMLDNM